MIHLVDAAGLPNEFERNVKRLVSTDRKAGIYEVIDNFNHPRVVIEDEEEEGSWVEVPAR